MKSEALNIMLDPGHGGDARGSFCEYDGVVIEEKNLNLKIASFIKNELGKYQTKNGNNVNVYLTRGQSDNPSMQERILLGVQKNADVIISLHNNASHDGSGSYRGAMALVTSSHFNNKHDIEENLSKNILIELNKLSISISHDTISGIANNDNGLLRRLADDGFTYPNGETADWYGIIMHGILNNVPSVLIEHAYLDNEEDYRQFLCTDDKLRNLALADVNGIVNYFGLVVKGSESKQNNVKQNKKVETKEPVKNKDFNKNKIENKPQKEKKSTNTINSELESKPENKPEKNDENEKTKASYQNEVLEISGSDKNENKVSYNKYIYIFFDVLIGILIILFSKIKKIKINKK